MDDPYSLSYNALVSLHEFDVWLDSLILKETGEDPEDAFEQVLVHLDRASSSLQELAHDNELVPESELTPEHHEAIALGHPPYYRPVLIPCFERQAAFATKLETVRRELAQFSAQTLPERSATLDCALKDIGTTLVKEFETMHLEDPCDHDEPPSY